MNVLGLTTYPEEHCEHFPELQKPRIQFLSQGTVGRGVGFLEGFKVSPGRVGFEVGLRVGFLVGFGVGANVGTEVIEVF